MPEGTPFVTLDGVERKLSDRDLMICDKEKPSAHDDEPSYGPMSDGNKHSQ